MNVDPQYYGPEDVTLDDEAYQGSTYAEVRRAIFANAYYRTWGTPGDPPLPVYATSLRRALSGVLPFGGPGSGRVLPSMRSRADRQPPWWKPGSWINIPATSSGL